MSSDDELGHDLPPTVVRYFHFRNGHLGVSRRLLTRQKLLCPHNASETAATLSLALFCLVFEHELDQRPRLRGVDLDAPIWKRSFTQ
jgi:hypothetical protein